MRDDFSQKIKLAVAERAGYRCSNPSCRRTTCGPHSDPTKAVNIGIAAHISAAFPGGPRYDPTITFEERSGIDNALWLCLTCAKAIDCDAVKYTWGLLRQWKLAAERVAASELVTFQNSSWAKDIKSLCRKLLERCDTASGTADKGQALEDLIEVLFTSDDGLALAHKRASTGDEEIDLVFINNVSRPFFLALRSPLFFVECKNWSSNVGAKEVRNFEIKLQNHGSLVAVGFFVSLNGFTSEVPTELKRMGRSGYHVVLIERGDILSYLCSEDSLVNWLEKRMCRLA